MMAQVQMHLTQKFYNIAKTMKLTQYLRKLRMSNKIGEY